MYFVVRYNWINDQLTDRCSVGFFRSLKRAKKFILNLPYSVIRNTVAIVKINEGLKDYSFPTEVYSWNEYYQIHIPVLNEDVRRSLTITY